MSHESIMFWSPNKKLIGVIFGSKLPCLPEKQEDIKNVKYTIRIKK